ncbi:MAG: methylated-DNA--[protein]-cysteine S-methyltransferase [Phycisphaerales bacterium]
MRHSSSQAPVAQLTRKIWTPLGQLTAVSDGAGLVSLSFEDPDAVVAADSTVEGSPTDSVADDVLRLVSEEIDGYFKGTLREFTVPMAPAGTAFQQQVWESLRRIPFGATRSYSAVAESIGRPTAVRATARANGDIRLVILVPCHRVIGAGGELTGYSAGLERKRWLLQHEQAVLGNREGLWSGA